jgi:hypothetical protein
MRSAKAAKVRQGYAVSRPPVGYVQSVRGKWIKDPDPKVQATVRLVVDLYLEHRSVGKVVRHMRRHHLPFPRKSRGETTWAPVTRQQVAYILTNPNYCDDYVFRRVKVTEASEDRLRQVERLSPEDWVVHQNHHDVIYDVCRAAVDLIDTCSTTSDGSSSEGQGVRASTGANVVRRLQPMDAY